MTNKIFLILISVFCAVNINAQSYRVIESTNEKIKLEFVFENSYQIADTVIDNTLFQQIKGKELGLRTPGEPWLPAFGVNAGLKFTDDYSIEIVNVDYKSFPNKFMLPFPDVESLELTDVDKYEYDKDIYSKNAFFPSEWVEFGSEFVFRYAKAVPVVANPFRFNPVTRELQSASKLTVIIRFKQKENLAFRFNSVSDKKTEDFIEDNLINSNVAGQWMAKSESLTESPDDDYEWYDPSKTYHKIYLNRKDVYRLTYNDLLNAGVLNAPVDKEMVRLYLDGEEIPIDFNAGSKIQMEAGDHFQFVGYPINPSPHAKQNLYNRSNIYWLTVEGGLGTPLRYRNKDGFPTNWNRTIKEALVTLHFEQDTLYERLGYAPNGNRDNWYWGKVSGSSGIQNRRFEGRFLQFKNYSETNLNRTLRVNLHGITNLSCTNDHKANIEITNQPLGAIEWDGQTEVTFEQTFQQSQNDINIYPTGNLVQVWTDGNVCNTVLSDDFRVNWFELDFWQLMRADSNHYFFTSPPGQFGINRYDVWQWFRDDMKIYMPSIAKFISNPDITYDPFNSVFFVDTLNARRDYFCVASDYFSTVDSIKKVTNSDLRNASKSADYIIITHKDFLAAAQRLKIHRENNLNGIANPRVEIVEVREIYNEFSYGKLDPLAIKEFTKYAFDNWSSPAPSYIALLGDMSYDYRGVLSDSRPNFVPSILHHSTRYGFAVADNEFATVAGDDFIPDMAIGRISCETLEEANILVDKIVGYPADQGKEWKQNILLIGAGQDAEDEASFGFNNQNDILDDFYITPNGYTTDKVYRFPNKPEHLPFQGDGPQIREKFNEGAVIANFYGHGGGYQWDLVFNVDDIYALENGNRMPIVSSVTCYTAHFDNQNVFGEIFNKIPGKGSIGFWGNTGLTFWTYGITINKRLFEQVLDELEPTIGKALLDSKVRFASSGTNKLINDNLALFSYLGDPGIAPAVPAKPDFMVKDSYIKVNPFNSLVGDTVTIKSNIRNLGRSFGFDTLTVEFKINLPDTSYSIDTLKLGNFGELDSVITTWVPDRSGFATLTMEVNQMDPIDELDNSDNIAQVSFTVFDLNEPNIIKPYDGYFTSDTQLKFLMADIGYYVNLNLVYSIQIDTAVSFNTPLISTENIVPSDGLVEWVNQLQLTDGIYFWRTRLFDGEKYSDWTDPRSFTITEQAGTGFLANSNQLKLFDSDNFTYLEEDKKLVLNTEILPPKPATARLRDTISVSLPNDFLMTTITTDGNYIYYANKTFFNGYQASPIYKIGTGFGGTVKGLSYDSIPNFTTNIWNSIFYHDGYIYVSTGDAYNLKKVDPVTGAFEQQYIPDGMLDNSFGTVVEGSQYLGSDGTYVYNIAFKDSATGENKFVIRTFDPANGWTRTREDLVTGSTSWGSQFSGFFIADGYMYPYENFNFGYMKRIRLSDGFFEEEWLTNDFEQGFQGYHSWTYDAAHDIVYTSVARNGFPSDIRSFIGRYKETNGIINSPIVGPASEWQSLSYGLETQGYVGEADKALLGFNNQTRNWDTLITRVNAQTDLSFIESQEYPYLQLKMSFRDSTAGATLPVKFSFMQLAYLSLPEVVVDRNDFEFTPDSLMQGFPIEMKFQTKNIGYSKADSVQIDFFYGQSDSLLYSTYVTIPPDSLAEVKYTIDTSPMLFFNPFRVETKLKEDEFFTFNNAGQDSFYVARDSLRPQFQVTFDGEEILNGDLISSKPQIFMAMEDNSPLPLDTSFFFIYLNNEVQSFKEDSLNYSYSPYPNSKAAINWNPSLPNGRHILEVLAKDASGNYFDTTSFRISFMVNTEDNIIDVYNYPNPFTDDTHFTFNLTGSNLPDEVNIKIYTIAGRLIREIDLPTSEMKFGFNKFYWDGRDEDGDAIANGVYFYKFTFSNNGESVSEIKKLVKLK